MRIACVLYTLLLWSPSARLVVSLRQWVQQSTRRQQSTSLTKLDMARKHLAVTYGGFLDGLPRKRPKEMVEVAERLSINEDTQSGVVTGDDKRRERNRNLKQVTETQGPLPDLHPPAQKRKWTDLQISQAIECLNRSYGRVARELLTDEQRVGVIDWPKFDTHAAQLIPGYSVEGQRVRTKVVSWVAYHRRKKDIRFEVDRWIFDPEGSDKRGRDKRRVRATKNQQRDVIDGLIIEDVEQ